jgi:hypothetical protein
VGYRFVYLPGLLPVVSVLRYTQGIEGVNTSRIKVRDKGVGLGLGQGGLGKGSLFCGLPVCISPWMAAGGFCVAVHAGD